MVAQEFRINKKKFEKAPLVFFQHKTRALMKCYTVRDLIIDEANFKFYFKKTHKISGLKMKDPKEYVGKYEIIETESDDEIILKLMI